MKEPACNAYAAFKQQNENDADWVSQDGNKDPVKRKFVALDANLQCLPSNTSSEAGVFSR
jgi:hypothetical protein